MTYRYQDMWIGRLYLEACQVMVQSKYDKNYILKKYIPHFKFKSQGKLHSFVAFIILCFGLVGFYGISIIVGYLIPNPLYAYILNI